MFENIKLVVGMNYTMNNCMISAVHVDEIAGLNHENISDEHIVIALAKFPIAMDIFGAKHLIPEPKFWKKEVENLQFSHILCLTLSEQATEQDKQMLSSLATHIHCNRTIESSVEITEHLKKNNQLQQHIEKAFGVDDALKSMEKLLWKNSYTQRHLSRLKKQQNVVQETVQKSLAPQEIWDAFAAKNDGVWLYQDIIDFFPSRRDAAKKRLDERIKESNKNLELIWKKIKAAIDNRNE